MKPTLLSKKKPDAREKLLFHGAQSLSDTELLMLLLRSGSAALPVKELAQQTLATLDTFEIEDLLEPLSKLKGLGTAKAASLIAALEFSRRRIRPHGIKVKNAEDVARLVSYLKDKEQEHFVSLSLNGAHEVKHVRVLTVGLVNSCQIHPREVLSHAISDRATSLIVAHNHPSGDTKPSAEDLALTQRLGDAAAIIGIPLLDHIIFGPRGHLSLAQSGYRLRSPGV